MKRRCSKETTERNNKSYFDKGIRVSHKWQNFEFFFIDMWSSYILHRELNDNDTELDRINNKKGYSKGNCRWSTRRENMNNTYNNMKIRGKTFSEWADKTGISRETLIRRHTIYKWSDEKVLNTPVGTWRNN